METNTEKVKLSPEEKLTQVNEEIESLTRKKSNIEEQIFNLRLKKQKLERLLSTKK